MVPRTEVRSLSWHYFGLAVDISQHHSQPGWDGSCEHCLKGRTHNGAPIPSVEKAKELKIFHQRYYIEPITSTGASIVATTGLSVDPVFWTVWCRVDQPSAKSVPLGPTSPRRQISFTDWSSGAPVFAPTLHPFPEGHYVDLSSLIEEDGFFTRIQAHDGWMLQSNAYNHTEWWHFSACIDGEVPFSKKSRSSTRERPPSTTWPS